MKEIKAYKCDHCGKVYQRKHNAKIHEEKCKESPDNNRACFGCRFLEKVELPVVFINSAGYEEIVNRDVLVCTKFKIGVYPPSVENHPTMDGYEILGNELEIEGNKAMPRECKDKELDNWAVEAYFS
jgi:hypothetical protein